MRRSVLVVIALLVPVATHWIVREMGFVFRMELLMYDWHVRALPPVPPHDGLVFVGMDDESLSRLPLDRPSYPLPRSMHAKVVRELHAAGSKVIAFDVIFTTPIPKEDAVFAEAIEASKPVLCGAEPSVLIVDGEELITLTPPAPLLRPHITACALNAPRVFNSVRWLLPSIVDANTSDRYPHLSAALAEALGSNISEATTGRDGEIPIRFIGPPGSFKAVPYHEVFNGTWRESRGDEFFRNKVVLVGTVSLTVDRAFTPVGDMQGTEILLHAAQTLAQGNWIRRWNETTNFLTKAVLSVLLALATWKLGVRRGFMIFVAVAAVWIFIAHRTFATTQVWIDSFEPTLALLSTLILTSAYEAKGRKNTAPSEEVA